MKMSKSIVIAAFLATVGFTGAAMDTDGDTVYRNLTIDKTDVDIKSNATATATTTANTSRGLRKPAITEGDSIL